MRLVRARALRRIEVAVAALLLDRAEPRAPRLARQRQPKRVRRRLERLERLRGRLDVGQIAERALDELPHLCLW